VLNEIYEPDFRASRMGSAGRNPHQASMRSMRGCKRARELGARCDIKGFLDRVSYCPWFMKIVRTAALLIDTLIRKALTPPLPHQHCFELAALTRCNTVCRETPSLRWSRASEDTLVAPAARCAPDFTRNSNLPRRARVTCSPAMKPSASQR